jgi:hypothetical protein
MLRAGRLLGPGLGHLTTPPVARRVPLGSALLHARRADGVCLLRFPLPPPSAQTAPLVLRSTPGPPRGPRSFQSQVPLPSPPRVGYNPLRRLAQDRIAGRPPRIRMGQGYSVHPDFPVGPNPALVSLFYGRPPDTH